jgi:galactokinase
MEDVAPANSLRKTVASATAHFGKRYGKSPRWIVAAPGRVNIIGEHVDYNDGFVLPMAIERYCVIAADVATGGSPVKKRTDEPSVATGQAATVYSATADDEAQIPVASPKPHHPAGHWSNYLAGVVAGFAEQGLRPPGFNAVVDSSVPIGGGLSSSASLEVAAATLLEAMIGVTLDPMEKALLCQKAEHDFAGVPCGIMDQFASAMCRADHLMLLDCRSRSIEHVPFLDPAITVLIVNTNVKHELSGGDYAERRRQCESAARKLGVASLRDAAFPQLQARRRFLDPIEYRRAKHVISEIARTVRAAAAVKAGEWPEMGRLMYSSHESLRDDYEVSCRELDVLVDCAKEIGPGGGVIGSRMTGGGFGGCTVSFVETTKVETVAAQLLQRYREATGIEASALTSRPACGAHVILNHEDGTE